MKSKTRNMKTKLIVMCIISIICIIATSVFVISYKPKCSMPRNPFGSEKDKVKIGEIYQNSYSDVLLCEKKGLLGWKWKTLAIYPMVSIYLFDGESISDSAGEIYVNEYYYAHFEKGKYFFEFPSCNWVILNKTTENGFERGYGVCNYTTYIETDTHNCTLDMGNVSYYNSYRLDLNNPEECEKHETYIN